MMQLNAPTTLCPMEWELADDVDHTDDVIAPRAVHFGRSVSYPGEATCVPGPGPMLLQGDYTPCVCINVTSSFLIKNNKFLIHFASFNVS